LEVQEKGETMKGSVKFLICSLVLLNVGCIASYFMGKSDAKAEWTYAAEGQLLPEGAPWTQEPTHFHDGARWVDLDANDSNELLRIEYADDGPDIQPWNLHYSLHGKELVYDYNSVDNTLTIPEPLGQAVLRLFYLVNELSNPYTDTGLYDPNEYLMSAKIVVEEPRCDHDFSIMCCVAGCSCSTCIKCGKQVK
jgi:hypothetical protein